MYLIRLVCPFDDYSLDVVGHESKGCMEYHANVFFMSCLLFIGTYLIASILKKFKAASFFPTVVRSYISDFAVIIAIIAMTVFDICVGVQTPKLKVPLSVSPTRDDRGWITPMLNGNPWWTILLAFVPALLGTILIFMDQQITAVIVNRKEFKLKVSES